MHVAHIGFHVDPPGSATARPAVSVILPTFNRLHYLRQAVESVFAQTFTDWELVIADDGSHGETLEYLQQLRDSPRVKLLLLPHSGNVSAVRNTALREAQGDYFAFLDSDDLWTSRKLEVQIAVLRCRTDCKWSYTGFQVVDAQLAPLSRAIRPLMADGWIIEHLLNAKTAIMVPSVVVERGLINSVGLHDESLRHGGGDYEMCTRLALHSPAAYVDQPLVLIRRHAEHSWDDITCCRDFAEALERIRRSVTRADLLPVIRKRRAIARARLARSEARSGRSMSALATVLASARHSWCHREWWATSGSAVAWAIAPAGVVSVLRRIRLRLRQQHS